MPVSAALAFYSDAYATARQRFRDAAMARGWLQSEYPIGARGPDGGALTIDVAISTGAPCKQALVISSGMHGVEGFFGSAVQLAALTDRAGATDNVRVIFVHALNPYGFAWSRRVNEDNVDLNRNFLFGGQRYAGSPPGYAKLDALLNPRTPPRWWDYFPLRAVPIIARHGVRALERTVAGGQYDHPQGLFFGGGEPSNTHRILDQHLPVWIGDSRRVLHLDFHTGLGRWGTYRLLTDDAMPSGWRSLTDAGLCGHRIIEPTGNDLGYPIRGGFGRWARSRFADRDYLLLYAEFGTYHPLRIALGLRAENQAHRWGTLNASSTMKAKRRLQQLFCPNATNWRARSLSQGLRLIRAAIAALNAN